MYPIKIIHLSDIHFSSPSLELQPSDIKQQVINFINEKAQEENYYLILSGDITFGANSEGYAQGKIFFNDIIAETNFDRSRIITCPGNHDISNGKFENFDIFSYDLRDDSVIKFQDNPNILLNFEDICFLSINSSYHLNHRYGLVNIDKLSTLLTQNKEQIDQRRHKIVIIHHHFLNFSEEDTSIIRNSYQVLDLLSSYNFNIIFHGHQHTKQKYTINDILVKGISSPTEGRSSSNLIGYYEITTENHISIEEYLYSKDTIQGGIMGRYIRNG